LALALGVADLPRHAHRSSMCTDLSSGFNLIVLIRGVEILDVSVA